MASFTGDAGTVPGNPGLYEWTDVIVVVENDVIVDFFSQFGNKVLPLPGESISIGGLNVRLSSLTYQNLGNAVDVGSLSLAAGAQFEQAASGFKISGTLSNSGSMTVSQRTVVGSSISNGGLMTVNSFLQLEGDDGQVALNGIGDLRLRGGGFLTGFGGQSSLVELNNQSRISGTGTIGADFNWLGFPSNSGYLAVNNSALGIIDADVAGQTLLIATTLSEVNPVENAGLLSASNGGTLALQGGFVEQSSTGVIHANLNSKVLLNNVSLSGGTLSSARSGVVDVEGFDTRIGDVTIAAGSTVNTGGYLALEGTITNRGTIVASDFDSRVRIDADGVTLTGGGHFVLVDNFGDSQIVGEAIGAVLTIGKQTIRGNGAITNADRNSDATLTVLNDGIISAQPDSYSETPDTLFVGNLAGLVNTGILEARSGATLALNNPGTGVIENADGLIRAVGAGAIVSLGNATISGGQLSTSAGGAMTAGAATLDGSASKLSTSAAITVSGAELKVTGAVENSGVITLANTADVTFTGDTMLTGGGSMIAYSSSYSEFKTSESGITVTNVDHTIGGAGQFGLFNGVMQFTNGRNGVVTANVDGGTLFVRTNAVLVNNGVMRADGGRLEIYDTLSGRGRLEITNGGTLMVGQNVDQDVRFVGSSADDLVLNWFTANAGGYDFSITGMGVGDRILTGANFFFGSPATFDFAFTSTGAVLSYNAFTGIDGQPYQVTLKGRYSEGQFELVSSGTPDFKATFVLVETKNGGNGNDRLVAVNAGERLIGFDGDDTLIGKGGNDVLDGSRGIDTANYGTAGAAVTVSLNTTAAQAVGAGLGMDRLLWIENLVGSSFGDTLTGNGGANRLDGGRGADTLAGLGGNDTYVVDRSGDVVSENAGEGGNDTVLAQSSYTLGAAAEIEVLRALSATGTDAFELKGNGFGQRVIGNAGNNRIDGGGGLDTVQGLGGSDTFVISSDLGAANVVTVLDFAADDFIELSSTVFGLTSPLTTGQLAINTTGTAQDADDRLIYDLDSGRLLFDADGRGGQKAILFAVIDANFALGAGDFLIG